MLIGANNKLVKQNKMLRKLFEFSQQFYGYRLIQPCYDFLIRIILFNYAMSQYI